jgi:hypothetical protein
MTPRKKLIAIGAIAGAILATGAVLARSYEIAGDLGVRPVLSRELDKVVGEVQVVAANLEVVKRDIDRRRFFELQAKKESSLGLSPIEFDEWCELGKALGYFQECRR